MRAALLAHPDLSSPAISIEAEAERSGGRLRLRYRLTGEIAGLRIPTPVRAERTDELWRHTCFEAFVAPASGYAYYECNFSPSSQWATYRFGSYRQGMAQAEIEAAPWGQLLVTAQELTLGAEVDLGRMPELVGPWRLNLSAVIEAANGTLSYWALAHPPGRPDFHHADCFALEVPAPQSS
jgi:hypothetical protein